MKKTLAIIAITSLVANTTITVINSFNFQKEQTNSNKSTNDVISKDLVNKYVQETSIIPKALLIGKNLGYSTDTLLTNLNSKLTKPIINFNMPKENGGNMFINDLTTNKLDINTINNIQSCFESNGTNQHLIDDANKKISQYNLYKNYSSEAIKYLNNTTLSSDNISNLLETFLKSAKTAFPDVTKYLQYVKYEKLLTLTSNELLNDWDQQSKWAKTPLAAMKNYIASEKGDIAQAKNYGSKGQWHYVAVRATHWTWNDFYQYIAGANLNYMIKFLGGKYIGDLITQNINSTDTSFNSDKFLSELNAAIDKLPITPKAWPYLVKAIVPVVKEQILKMQNPTLGVKDLTWNNKSRVNNANKSVELKVILQEIAHLLSPEGKQDLTKLIANLLQGPFAEDIMVNLGLLVGKYTLPELFSDFSWFSDSLDPQKLAANIVDKITKATNPLNIPTLLNKVINFTDKYLTKNPQIDLRDLSNYLNNIFSDNFNQALNEAVDIINNPNTSQYKASDILALLGVQKKQDNFKVNSPLFYLQQWLQQPNSSINQVLAILTNKKDNTGIIDNMIKEQQDFLKQNYYRYFDINNQTRFKITNVVATKNQGVINLSYSLTDVANKKNYNLVFISQDQDHKTFLLDRIE